MRKTSLYAGMLVSSMIAAPFAVHAEEAMVLPIKRLTMDTAIKMAQAYTAMSFNAATGTLTGKLFDTAGSIGKMDGVVAVRGGLSINVGGTILGGIGVSGASSKVDEECAKAGIDAVIADLEMSM